MPAPADAHRLKAFATVVGASIEGKAYFVGGGPAENVAATLVDKSSKVIAETRTDTEGRFVLTAPVRADVTVVIDATDGHLARFEIAASRLPDLLPAVPEGGSGVALAAATGPPSVTSPPTRSTASADQIAAAVARQIEPLAEQLDSLEASIRLRDVLGGVGYIIGIFGLVAFMKVRRDKSGGGRV